MLLKYFYFGPVGHPATFGLTHTRRGQISRRIPGIIRLMLQRPFSIEIWIVRFKCRPEI